MVFEADLARRCFSYFFLSFVSLSGNLESFWRQILAVVAFTFLYFSHLCFYKSILIFYLIFFFFNFFLKSWVVLEADLGRRCCHIFIFFSSLFLSYIYINFFVSSSLSWNLKILSGFGGGSWPSLLFIFCSAWLFLAAVLFSSFSSS